MATSDKFSREPSTNEGPAPGSIDVIVRKARGLHPIYGIDERHGAIRLEGVSDGFDGPADLAFLPDSLGWNDAEVTVLLITRVPTFEGCLVSARIIGGFMVGDQLAVVVAVPGVDSGRMEVSELSSLATALREWLAGWAQQHLGIENEMTPVESLTVTQLVQEARRRARLARAQAQEGPRFGAAWLVTTPSDQRKTEGEPHTWAENLLPQLPLRFQKYVAGLLLDAERILFFLERPPFRAEASGRLGIVRGRRVHAGLLVITDRMVLMMEDAIPPGATMVHWGYVAEATAIERVVSASLRRDGKTGYLEVEVESDGTTGLLSWPFPVSQTPELEQATMLLRGFVARPSSTALRRLYRERERRSPAAELAASEGITVGVKEHLEEVKALKGEEAPAEIAAAGREAALSITDTAVYWLLNGQRQGTTAGKVMWLGLDLSLMGCRLRLALSDNNTVHPINIRFDYPQSPDFVRAFTRIRHQMGRPSV